MQTIFLPGELVALMAPALKNCLSKLHGKQLRDVNDLMLRLNKSTLDCDTGTAIIALMATLLYTLNQTEVDAIDFTIPTPKNPELN